MAKLDRKDVKIFAENSKETLITEFRTEDSEGNTASFSRDPDVIQNENYSQGWVNDTNNLNTKIYGEDLNAVNYVLSYLLKYLYENGIAEWKSTTTYYQNSICKVDNALYLSLQNNNIGNDPTSTVSYWKLIPLENVSIEDAGSGFSIVKDVTDNVITFKTISVTGYGEITDNGDQLNIDIAGGGGGGGGDTYWGTIRGTITNQTDLMALINLKQDVFTVDSPLVLTDEQHLTINKATSSVSGYLDYNDFNTFNNKQDTISATLPISITNNNIEIETADTSTTGALSYTDWNTFNNKQDAINGLTITETSTTFDAVPKSTITTSNIGSNTYPISNVYCNTSHSNKLIANDASTGYIEFQANQNKYRCESGKTHDFVMGADTIASIGYLDSNTNGLKMSGSISASANSTYNIGSGGFRFKNLYVGFIGDGSHYTDVAYLSQIWTDSLLAKPTSYGITLKNDLIGDSLTVASLGTATYPINGLNVINGTIKNLTIENLYSSGNTIYLQGNMRDSGPGAHNLGSNDNYFAGVYAGGFITRPSDIREKENIENYKNSVLDKLDKLNTMTYTIKGSKDGEVKFGLSAQELQEIEPLCVVGSETKSGEKLGIDLYATLTLAMQAIKELNAKVEALEARVNELEGNKKELEK